MCNPVAAVIGTVASALTQRNAAKKAASAQDAATRQATEAANKQAADADMAFNKANGKQANVQGMSSENEMAAKGGASGTMLTGPMGVDPKSLLLGKTTLLGG